MLLPILAFLAAFGGFWAPQLVSAADGVNASGMGQTHAIADGISKDGLTACVVWSQFDVGSPQAWVRVYDVTTSTFGSVVQVSNAGNGGVASTHCTFDSVGRLHVTWQQKSGGGPLEIMHRFRSIDGTWQGINTVSGNGDTPDITADNSGRVWISYHKFNGDNAPGEIHLISWLAGNYGSEVSFTASGAGGEPRVAADNNGYVHFAFKNGGSGRGYAYYNSNNGQFSQEVGIPGSNSAGNFSLAVSPADGDVHVVYSKNFNEIFYAKKSGSASLSFSGAVNIANADDRALNPQIAWSNGRVFVAFDSGNKDRIDYVTADNEGNGWSGIQNLADPSGSANGGGGAESPWVVLDPNGNAYVAYAHRSDGTVYFVTNVGPLPPELRCAGYADVHKDGPACPAITSLSQSGVINGYATNPPTFGPNQIVQRAQIAAFLVRSLQWQNLPKGPKSFNDFGPLVGELRDDALILANACTPAGSNTCVAQGYGDGRFGPNDNVTYAQIMSFVTRAFIYDSRSVWVSHPEGPQYYNGVPAVHAGDVATYNYYVGDNLQQIVPMPSTPDGWNQPAPRAWVAVVIYEALQVR
jgi:S-layer homology domain